MVVAASVIRAVGIDALGVQVPIPGVPVKRKLGSVIETRDSGAWSHPIRSALPARRTPLRHPPSTRRIESLHCCDGGVARPSDTKVSQFCIPHSPFPSLLTRQNGRIRLTTPLFVRLWFDGSDPGAPGKTDSRHFPESLTRW